MEPIPEVWFTPHYMQWYTKLHANNSTWTTTM